jgi:hypothetical protein
MNAMDDARRAPEFSDDLSILGLSPDRPDANCMQRKRQW